MKYNVLTLLIFTIICCSCRRTCDKTLRLTAVDAQTEETVPNILISIEAKNDLDFGASFQTFTETTDELGQIEINTDLDFDSWETVRIESNDYYLLDSEFAFVSLNVCDENDEILTLHRLSTVNINFYDDMSIPTNKAIIISEYYIDDLNSFYSVDEMATLRVLEEIPNNIYIDHVDEANNFIDRDTVVVQVPRDNTLTIEVGL